MVRGDVVVGSLAEDVDLILSHSVLLGGGSETRTRLYEEQIICCLLSNTKTSASRES